MGSHPIKLVRRMRLFASNSFGIWVFLVLTGCAAHRVYPDSWAPIPAPTTQYCTEIAGTYADRGESPGSSNRPSLTGTLFGSGSGWRRATRVSFSLPRSELLEVTVWQGTSRLFSRVLSSWAGHFICKRGRLVVHNQRLVSATGGAQIEKVTITFGIADDYLVAQVQRIGAGGAAIVPVADATTSWLRFPRLRQP